MLKFFKRREPQAPQTTPRARQRRRHEILDEHDHPEDRTGEGRGVPDPLPDRDRDYRLQFHFWFAQWDQGAEARKRASSRTCRRRPWRSKRTRPARSCGKGWNGRGCTDSRRPTRKSRSRSWAKADMPLHAAFSQADTPFIHLHDGLADMAERETGEAGAIASSFLREPLYRIASTYDVANWIVWPLCATLGALDPTEAAYRLCEGGWSPGWNGNDVFVFDKRAEFGLV